MQINHLSDACWDIVISLWCCVSSFWTRNKLQFDGISLSSFLRSSLIRFINYLKCPSAHLSERICPLVIINPPWRRLLTFKQWCESRGMSVGCWCVTGASKQVWFIFNNIWHTVVKPVLLGRSFCLEGCQLGAGNTESENAIFSENFSQGEWEIFSLDQSHIPNFPHT